MPFKQTIGSRAKVMHGTAKKTTGGLTKFQLKYNKQGKIVSKKASALAKKNNRLVKAVPNDPVPPVIRIFLFLYIKNDFLL